MKESERKEVKTPSGTKVLVGGRFIGWKCNHCLAGCRPQNKYGVCHY